jgi:hypothetical protein
MADHVFCISLRSIVLCETLYDVYILYKEK